MRGIRLLASPWVMKILEACWDKPAGFNFIKAYCGRISGKTLAATLRDLEAAGLVERRPLAQPSNRVDYAILDHGIIVAQQATILEMKLETAARSRKGKR